jgi:lysophospholipase L1-like esterase
VSFQRYIAPGDSISIDDYPARETGRRGIGAASLFHRELERLYPEIAFENLTADGATTTDVLSRQLKSVRASPEETIVTLTAGGNDMLMNLRSPSAPADLPARILANLATILDEIARELPNGQTLIGTVYDPSDGTNVLYGEKLEREAAWLAEVNEGIRELAKRERVVLADIHAAFLGHGMTAPPTQRWYWEGLIFEPNARGAEAVCEVWTSLLPPQREKVARSAG